MIEVYSFCLNIMPAFSLPVVSLTLFLFSQFVQLIKEDPDIQESWY